MRNVSLTWRSTWDFALQPSVLQAWKEVALYHHSHVSDIVMELLVPDTIKSHGDAIHYLKLLKPVIRPVSLQQIRLEHRIRERVQNV